MMPGQIAAKVRAKYPGVYEDLDDVSLEKAVLTKHPEYADLAEAPSATSVRARTWGDTARDVGAGIVNALPAIGGAIGGMAGGPGGALAGGAAGSGYRTAIQRASEIPGAVADVARNLVQQPVATLSGFTGGMDQGGAAANQEGIVQAGLQKGGTALAAGANKASSYLMGRALNLSERLGREFPGLSQTLIDHSLAVSQGGLNKARALLRTAKDAANTALTTADAAGARVPITAATDGLTKTLRTVIESGNIEGGLRTLAAVERQMIGGRGAQLTNVEADALKRSLQTESKALYTAAKMGTGRPNVSVRAQAIADMAQSLNAGIADATEQAGATGYKAANADAREMIGAVRGITKAVARGAKPASTLYQAGTNMLTSPANTSRLALVLSKPSVQAMLKQSPRLAATLAQFVMNQEPE